jgi:hypothetical protein
MPELRAAPGRRDRDERNRPHVKRTVTAEERKNRLVSIAGKRAHKPIQCCLRIEPCMASAATLRRMEYARLETAALAHVNDDYYYGAYCGKCKHSARLSLVIITFLAPHHRT